MKLTGIHHVTAISADAPGNRRFYVETLGMRLVKKTVNQDDTSAYHLFYADGAGSPGTDLTFFDWPASPARRGTHAISRTALRVADEASLAWWRERLTTLGIAVTPIRAINGRPAVDFEDPEGQRLTLIADGGAIPFVVWDKSTVPAEHQIRGLGPVTISVPKLERTQIVLTQLLGLELIGSYRDAAHATGEIHVFKIGEGGPAAELHVAVEPDLPQAREGAGGVHHLALRTPTFADYDAWAERLRAAGYPNSGPVDRFYFRSLYLREPNGILIEIATDEPGFAADEPAETMGETLALPPFLEGRRAQIEAGLKPL
ncbi:ring-cleaving dioxygenase [Bosea sp. (in: a-proteobacteria)]|uniref:ring-cleaving dioxygenase n=1 Tax=Bosea sp. (in: a-proteobacteria) TaxID=1871050 RepID=UPI002734D5A4|nr:ring-cleaving dioxygenase [Bosea sp. (in: a-proteobacteria)]MDP3409649.1 ring-cleaving dioxygenase [Bosea sp. (in: a-proteobacteria)]